MGSIVLGMNFFLFNFFQKRTMKDTNRRTQKTGPLVAKVFSATLCALQSLAVRLLSWLSLQAQEFRTLHFFSIELTNTLFFLAPLAEILSESLLYVFSYK